MAICKRGANSRVVVLDACRGLCILGLRALDELPRLGPAAGRL